MVFMSCQPIKAGEELTISYGPKDLETLKEQYGFDCTCKLHRKGLKSHKTQDVMAPNLTGEDDDADSVTEDLENLKLSDEKLVDTTKSFCESALSEDEIAQELEDFARDAQMAADIRVGQYLTDMSRPETPAA